MDKANTTPVRSNKKQNIAGSGAGRIFPIPTARDGASSTTPNKQGLRLEKGSAKEREDELHWEKYFQRLKKHYDQFGDDAGDPESKDLARWVRIQRKLHRKKKLKGSRYERLKSIGFISWVSFNGNHDPWQQNFDKLVEFKKMYGNTLLPLAWRQDKALAQWVSDQRRYYKNGSLKVWRMCKLQFIGFTWDGTTKKHKSKRRHGKEDKQRSTKSSTRMAGEHVHGVMANEEITQQDPVEPPIKKAKTVSGEEEENGDSNDSRTREVRSDEQNLAFFVSLSCRFMERKRGRRRFRSNEERVERPLYPNFFA